MLLLFGRPQAAIAVNEDVKPNEFLFRNPGFLQSSKELSFPKHLTLFIQRKCSTCENSDPRVWAGRSWGPSTPAMRQSTARALLSQFLMPSLALTLLTTRETSPMWAALNAKVTETKRGQDSSLYVNLHHKTTAQDSTMQYRTARRSTGQHDAAHDSTT